MTEYDDDLQSPEPPSKSARKREMERLQKLGERLLTLKPEQLANMALSDLLRAAIAESRRIKSHEGLRRHRQYIGKLMREADSNAIETALNLLEQTHQTHTRLFHDLENTRNELITEHLQGNQSPALERLLNQHPGIDRQHLRQLIRQAARERQSNAQQQANPTPKAIEHRHGRVLFRYLRELITVNSSDISPSP
jgi:ribosome-associated protein